MCIFDQTLTSFLKRNEKFPLSLFQSLSQKGNYKVRNVCCVVLFLTLDNIIERNS